MLVTEQLKQNSSGHQPSAIAGGPYQVALQHCTLCSTSCMRYYHEGGLDAQLS